MGGGETNSDKISVLDTSALAELCPVSIIISSKMTVNDGIKV